jgi:hypothetical protein
MLPTVQFDDELAFRTRKVGDVSSDRMLSPELPARESPTSEVFP